MYYSVSFTTNAGSLSTGVTAEESKTRDELIDLALSRFFEDDGIDLSNVRLIDVEIEGVE